MRTDPRSFAVCHPPAITAHHFNLRKRPYEPLHPVEDVFEVTGSPRNRGHGQHRPLPAVLMVDLGSRDAEAAMAALEDRLDDGPLVLERMGVRKVQVERQSGGMHGALLPSYVRGISRSSKVSMTSPWCRSWLLDRPMPHSKPACTSRTSSLNRLSEVMAPFQMITPSRRKRTFDPRVMTPLRT